MKQTIIDFSGKEIQNALEKARCEHSGMIGSVRILFAPSGIDQGNINRAASVYSRLNPGEHDTVIVVEELTNVLDKKLPMPSSETHKTPLGKVPVNDDLRNEFCDEDDDFFIDDTGLNPDLSLFQQLMMLQQSLRDFKVLNIQIADEDMDIIKELVSAIDELLPTRNVLLIFCCDLKECNQDDFKEIKSLIAEKSHSRLFNLLNSKTSCMNGTAAFMAGILVAHLWGLQIYFLDDAQGNPSLTAYAEREHVLF